MSCCLSSVALSALSLATKSTNPNVLWSPFVSFKWVHLCGKNTVLIPDKINYRYVPVYLSKRFKMALQVLIVAVEVCLVEEHDRRAQQDLHGEAGQGHLQRIIHLYRGLFDSSFAHLYVLPLDEDLAAERPTHPCGIGVVDEAENN